MPLASLWPFGRKNDTAPPPAEPVRPRKPYLFMGRREGHDCKFDGEGAILTVGPPGTGKSRGVAYWNLRDYPSSMLVTDPKGQLFEWSAGIRRERYGHEIVVLDPFGKTGQPSSSLNPLGPLLAAVDRNHGVETEALRIGHLLVPDNPQAKEPFWREGARGLVIGCLLYLAYITPEECDLPHLHELLWMGRKAFADIPAAMLASAGTRCVLQYGGDLQDLMEGDDRYFDTFRREARQAVSIYAPGESCGEVSRVSDIDFSKLISGRMTVYIVLPPEYLHSHGKWAGLVASHAAQAIMAAPEKGDCVFLLDEFPNIGALPAVVQTIEVLREKGVRVWMFVQALSQLAGLYGETTAETIRSQAEVLQVLGCNDEKLANYISTAAGKVTKMVPQFTAPDPLDPLGIPGKQVQPHAVPVFSVPYIMGMLPLTQYLVRRGYPVRLAEVVLWTGDSDTRTLGQG